jgi:hypothetical protein
MIPFRLQIIKLFLLVSPRNPTPPACRNSLLQKLQQRILKLVRYPRSLAPTLVTLPSMSLIPFAPLKLVRYPRSLAPTLVTLPWALALPRARASSPSCVSVHPRDSRSRRVLCHSSLALQSDDRNDGSCFDGRVSASLAGWRILDIQPFRRNEAMIPIASSRLQIRPDFALLTRSSVLTQQKSFAISFPGTRKFARYRAE